jgi:formylglycine-generating enzyme required for sulfatase activity
VLQRVVEDDPRPIREVIPEMPQWLCEIIAKLQDKKPEDRFQSARELADVLADCEAQLKAYDKLKNFSRIPPSKPAAGRSGRWKWVALAALLLPVFALMLTEIVGATHWFQNQHPMPDRLKNVEGQREGRKRQEDKELPSDFTNTLGMKFKLIPSGKFRMGSSQEEIDHFLGMSSGDDVLKLMLQSEGPEHEVEITKPFYMGTTEITVGQFWQFIEASPKYDVGDDRWKEPGFYQSDDYPVVWVSWQNAVDFCNWLSKKEGRTYHLPTEAEWEYGCRAGETGTRYSYGDDDAQLEDYAWFHHHSGAGTRRVGEKKPNAWGLYDMHGNVFELCQDWHDLNYYKSSTVKDPMGPAGTSRVTRGGGWNYQLVFCRTAFRSWVQPDERRDCIGFRVLLVAPPDGLRLSGRM